MLHLIHITGDRCLCRHHDARNVGVVQLAVAVVDPRCVRVNGVVVACVERCCRIVCKRNVAAIIKAHGKGAFRQVQELVRTRFTSRSFAGQQVHCLAGGHGGRLAVYLIFLIVVKVPGITAIFQFQQRDGHAVLLRFVCPLQAVFVGIQPDKAFQRAAKQVAAAVALHIAHRQAVHHTVARLAVRQGDGHVHFQRLAPRQAAHGGDGHRCKRVARQGHRAACGINSQRLPIRAVRKVNVFEVRAALALQGFVFCVIQFEIAGKFASQFGDRKFRHNAVAVHCRGRTLAAVRQAVHRNDLQGVGGVVADVHGKAHGFAGLDPRLVRCFGEADRRVFADTDTLCDLVAVDFAKVLALLVLAPDRCGIGQQISILCFVADVAGIVDGADRCRCVCRDRLVCQRPAQRSGAVVTLGHLRFDLRAAGHLALLALAGLLVRTVQIGRVRDIAQVFGQHVLNVHGGRGRLAGSKRTFGADGRKIQRVVDGVLGTVQVIDQFFGRRRSAFLHHALADLRGVIHHQAGVTVVALGRAAFVSVCVIFRFLVVFKAFPVVCIVGPDRRRVIARILGRGGLTGAAGEMVLCIIRIIRIGQRGGLFAKRLRGRFLHVPFVPRLGGMRHHVHVAVGGRSLQLAGGRKVDLRRLAGGNAAGFQQHRHTGIALVFQLLQRGEEDQIIRRGVDHLRIITGFVRLFAVMVPAAFVRLCAVQQRQLHVADAAFVADRRAFDVKKRIVKLHQVVVGHAGVQAFRPQMRQLFGDVDVGAFQAPVPAIVMAGIGDLRAGIVDVLLDFARLLQRHRHRLPVVGRDRLVAVVVGRIRQRIAADAGRTQVHVLHCQVELAVAVFGDSLIAARCGKRLHDPDLPGREAGGLYVPIPACKHSGVIIFRVGDRVFGDRVGDAA